MPDNVRYEVDKDGKETIQLVPNGYWESLFGVDKPSDLVQAFGELIFAFVEERAKEAKEGPQKIKDYYHHSLPKQRLEEASKLCRGAVQAAMEGKKLDPVSKGLGGRVAEQEPLRHPSPLLSYREESQIERDAKDEKGNYDRLKAFKNWQQAQQRTLADRATARQGRIDAFLSTPGGQSVRGVLVKKQIEYRLREEMFRQQCESVKANVRDECEQKQRPSAFSYSQVVQGGLAPEAHKQYESNFPSLRMRPS